MNTTPNKPKKVLLMVTKSNMGGAQKYVFDLANSLQKGQLDISIAAGGDGELFSICKEQEIKTIQLPFLDRDISIFKEFKAFFALYKILKESKPDVVHLNSPKMGGLGGLAARFAGIHKIIYTNHGWTFHEDRPWYQKMLIKLFSYIIVSLSTTTIILSQKERDDAKRWPFVQNKFTLIPLGINPPVFQIKEYARRTLLELAGVSDTDQEVILSIGELTKNKGYVYAIDALAKYKKEFTYIIIGTGELQAELQNKVKELELESKIKLIGFVKDAAKLLKGSDVFLLPSIKEGLPYVVLEAGFAEIPIISTNVGGIGDILDNKNTLISPKNSEEILSALISNKTYVPHKLDIINMLNKTLESYQS